MSVKVSKSIRQIPYRHSYRIYMSLPPYLEVKKCSKNSHSRECFSCSFWIGGKKSGTYITVRRQAPIIERFTVRKANAFTDGAGSLTALASVFLFFSRRCSGKLAAVWHRYCKASGPNLTTLKKYIYIYWEREREVVCIKTWRSDLSSTLREQLRNGRDVLPAQVIHLEALSMPTRSSCVQGS